jgi:regulator of sigma E protease
MFMLLTLVCISLLVVLHELGHLLMARAFGMRVLRFSVGFGPTLFSKKFGEITWQIAAIPMGGYVQIDGMGGEAPPAALQQGAVQPSALQDAVQLSALQGAQRPAALQAAEPAIEQASAIEQRSPVDPQLFSSKPVWQRLLVIFAGPASNWLTSAVLLTGLAATAGLAHMDLSQPVLGDLTPAGPAAVFGLRPGDRVVSVAGEPVGSWNDLVLKIQAHPDQPVEFVVQRPQSADAQAEPQTVHLSVTPKRSRGNMGMVEAQPYVQRQIHRGPSSLPAGIAAAWELTVNQGQLLAGMFTGHSAGHLTGLPGIVKTVSKQAQQAMSRLFEQMATISIGLCLLNLLPVPALDGSRLLFLLIELIRRRPLDGRIEGMVHTAGFVLLLGVMAFVSVRDML